MRMIRSPRETKLSAGSPMLKDMRKFVVAGESMGVRLVLLVLIFFGFGLSRLSFDAELAVWSVLQGSAVVGLLGIGIMATMIAGELDLSVAAIAGFSAIVTVRLLDHEPFLAAVAGVAVGGLIGVVQGLGIVLLRMSSLVFTLGSMILISGLQITLTPEGRAVFATDMTVSIDMTKRFWVVTPIVTIFLIAAILFHIFLRYSRTGAELYAFGGGRKEAALAGLKPGKVVLICFIFSGVFSGLSGTLSALSSSSANPNSLAPLLLTAITVALLGGVGLHGGVGSPLGVVVGTLLLVSMTTELGVRGVSADAQSLAIGGFLLLTICLEIMSAKTPRASTVDARENAGMEHV